MVRRNAIHFLMWWLVFALSLLAPPALGNQSLRFIGLSGDAVEIHAPAAGQPLLVHFWATWCPSCVEDLTSLQTAMDACAGSEIRVVGVNVGDDPEDVMEFTREHGLTLTQLRDPKGAIWRKVDGRGLPVNLILANASRRTEIGPKTVAEWRAEFGELGCSQRGEHP